MGKYTWAGCVIVAAAVPPILAAEVSVEVTIRGRLKDQSGPTTITVGEGETARAFTLLLPDDPAMRTAAGSLDGKTAVVSGSWERKEVTIGYKAIIKPSTRVVLVNGVEKLCPREREGDVRGAEEGDRFRAGEIPFSRHPRTGAEKR